MIASSQLVRRGERAEALLEAEPWDLLVLDEAHHARRRAAATGEEDRPNALLALMRRLKDRTDGLVLLTATPMQVDPVEVWDLLSLLGLAEEWTAERFLRFFEDIGHPNPSHEAVARAARLFRAAEAAYDSMTDGARATHRRSVAAENGQGAAGATRRAGGDAVAEAGERGALGGIGRDALLDTDSPPGLAAHARTAAPLLPRGDARHGDRRAPGRGPVHRHDRR